jgi:TonB family protein
MVRQIPAFVMALAITASGGASLAQSPDQAAGAPPVRVGGPIKAPTKLKDVPPIYPAIALAARQEGVVILELIVGTTGAVEQAKVIRSVPLLDQAALDAVKQWEYTPTLLNGVPNSVLYNVTVAFSLRTPDSATTSPTPPAANVAPSTASGNTGATGGNAGAGTTTPGIVVGNPTGRVDSNTAGAVTPVRVGGAVKAPTKLVDVAPVYPAEAQASRTTGVVILELLIAPQGFVQEARVIRSVPGLDQAALDAVRQWVYEPTLLNGVAVPVFYNVTVNFMRPPQ